jgi:ABC-type branched-subunit amino acid transport system substrate-binding protein
VWPRTLNKSVRQVVTANGGDIVGEEYFPINTTDYSTTINKILSSGTQVVFITIVPPGLTPFLEQLYNAGFTKRGGHLASVAFNENTLTIVPPTHVEGLYSCLDYFQNISDPFSKELTRQYDKLYADRTKFTGGLVTGMYRGLKFWEAAVKEAGSLKHEDVIKALDHAKLAAGPGGPAEMVPGQHHVRMHMYIAQVKNGDYEILKNLGAIDPKECVQAIK